MIKHTTCCIVNVMEKWISLFYFILQNAAIAMFGHISKKSPAHELKLKVRSELNRTLVRLKGFKAQVRLSSVAH